MPRKAFIADITAAAGQDIPRIISVDRGDDDGDINFVFSPLSGPPIELCMIALEPSGYPKGNNYMIFARSSDPPKGVVHTLKEVEASSAGCTVAEVLSMTSERLQKVLATGAQGDPFNIISSDVEMIDEDCAEDEGEEEDDDDDEYNYSDFEDGPRTATASTYRITLQNAATLNRRIKEDLRAVKFAGFKIGILSGLKAESRTSVVSISLQASKLGLSEEALQAWDLEQNQYVVLLIRYSGGYKPFESVIQDAAKTHEVEFRIGVSNKYKPTIPQALAAFTDISKSGYKTANEQKLEDAEQGNKEVAGFNSLFISSSLNDFINEQFISLLKIRYSMGIGWGGAKRFYNDKQGRLDDQNAALPAGYDEESGPTSSLPDIVSADHLQDLNRSIYSFPLIAAQFAMRYLRRCTEFCLVCHDKIEEGFEALKPYVCSKPLCLYQYMSLGFGPSVEHEILTQPYVVDLLVSFCYTAALCRRLREYPTGMSLHVPPVMQSVTVPNAPRFGYQAPAPAVPLPISPTITTSVVDVRYDAGRQEIVFPGSIVSSPVYNGEWVVITIAGQNPVHYRVEDISLYPTVKLSDDGITRPNPWTTTVPAPSVVPATPATTPPPPMLVAATMAKYDQMFDDMDEIRKAESIIMLLDTLPTIKELQSYLVTQGRSSEPNLRLWKQRVSPATLGILRWIIASNRSCIVQVDICPGQTEEEVAKAKIRLDQKCTNVDGHYVQFRFAQGAPDKEQRFLDALKAQQASLNPNYPTMFAWHGSPLQNWHSIIRHGLDFKETLHGRAFGHGVYHAQDQNVSVGYSALGNTTWPGSSLRITSAMSLNEIVNCPEQFVSSNPYIVVQHIDWIQCRYLFVQTTADQGGNNSRSTPNPATSPELEQDPKHTAKTTTHKPVGVPQCAISVSRAFRATNALDVATKMVNKRPSPLKKSKPSTAASELSLTNTTMSDEDEMEDIMFLLTDTEDPVDTKNGKAKEVVVAKPAPPPKSMTDFVPGSLDQSTLPMLEPPSYATPSATLRLNRELKTILKIQDSTPPHELGWYIDRELVSNVYQWIVELHSFESSLPLAKDMTTAGISSVVLEIRFGKDYPHSPPFVRVIRPRFLPFMNGGGGHVTGGGAMCMELLTNSGWSAVSSIEGVLLQVRMAIMNLEPKPAHLESVSKGAQRDYGTHEAMEAYVRACRTHGWQIPKDFQDFSGGAGSSS